MDKFKIIATIVVVIVVLGIGIGFNGGFFHFNQNNDSTNTDLSWNVRDLNVQTNGNLEVASKILDVISPEVLKNQSEEPSAANVYKAPWKYYGKKLKISGEVTLVQEYPPGSAIASAFGGSEVGELVFVTDDNTIVDYVLLGSTGNIIVGNRVNTYGYCTGHIEVENKFGGKTTQLMVIGKVAEKLN
ncbi:MAG: hypothetical protein ACM3YE_10215 [Bacteroidota bacterium]